MPRDRSTWWLTRASPAGEASSGDRPTGPRRPGGPVVPPSLLDPSTRPSPRRGRLAVGAAMLLASLATAALVCGLALTLSSMRERELAGAERFLRTLDSVLLTEVRRSMVALGDTLDAAAAGALAPDPAEALRAALAPRRDQAPAIASLSLLDSYGRTLASASPGAVAAVPFLSPGSGARDLDALREAPEAGFAVLPGDGGAPGLRVARRLSGVDGAFAGAVVAVLDPAPLAELLRSSNLGPGSIAGLWRPDGRLVLSTSTFGVDPAMVPVPATPGPVPTASWVGPADARILFVVAGSADCPVYVGLGRTEATVFADWRRVLSLVASTGALCVLSLLLVVLMMVRHLRTHAAYVDAVEARRRSEADRVVVEEQLFQSRKLDAIGQLTGGIAHDFNNLLTGTMGSLELLERHLGGRGDKPSRWISNALSSARRGSALTQRLLAFSRRQTLDPRPVDVARCVEDMGDLLERTLGENVTLETSAEPGLGPAFADLDHLDSAILNLVLNARDAMAGVGTILVEVVSATLPDGGPAVAVRVTDDGPGVDPSLAARIFEPFFTTKGVGKGTGLGLSQVHGFARQSGGVAYHERPSDGGARFVIVLPVSETPVLPRGLPVPQDPAFASSFLAPAVDPSPREGRIVLVEDDRAVSEFSIEVLASAGYRVDAVPDGALAVDAVLHGGSPVALVIADVGLPGMSGCDIVEELAALRPDLPLILTTGHSGALGERAAALSRHLAIDLLAKPYSASTLLVAVASSLEPGAVGAARPPRPDRPVPVG